MRTRSAVGPLAAYFTALWCESPFVRLCRTSDHDGQVSRRRSAEDSFDQCRKGVWPTRRFGHCLRRTRAIRPITDTKLVLPTRKNFKTNRRMTSLYNQCPALSNREKCFAYFFREWANLFFFISAQLGCTQNGLLFFSPQTGNSPILFSVRIVLKNQY